MKVAIIKSKDPWFVPSLLTKWFTGCRAYHVGFLAEETGWFYDMDVMRRRVKWSDYVRDDMVVELFNCAVSENYLVGKIISRGKRYGIGDYLSFFFRRLGFKVKNRNGLICSEMVNNDLAVFGPRTDWSSTEAPPSPCDLLKFFRKLNGYDTVQ